MKLSKLLADAGVMSAGLFLVLITLSGQTRTLGVIASVVSVALFMVAAMIDDNDDVQSDE